MAAMQHASLTEERWSEFTLDQQILMIGNEMNRGRKLMDSSDRQRLRNCYERVLRLVDLTIGVQHRRNLRRELLRWRDLVAQLYVERKADPRKHDSAFRCLLYFTPAASQQIQYLFGGKI